jgi:hypothetical protein
MKKICLIICYFGKLPNYFQLWLNSCKLNPTIDFLMFIDDRSEFDIPKNVKVIYTDLKKIKEIAQSKFDFEISLEYSYKLCDYKPAYGLIFEDYLKEYDFWGYCDLDVIFGNLRKFLDEELINKYEKIFKAGHFTIYKNTNLNKFGFENILDSNGEKMYKYVYITNSSFYFDEFFGILKLYGVNKKYSMYSNRSVIADILPQYRNFIVCSQLEFKNCIFQWKRDGDTCSLVGFYDKKEIKSKEFMYIHLQKRHMKINVVSSDNFFIVPDKFISARQVPKEYLYCFNYYRIYYIKYRIKRYFQRVFLEGGKI